ncbi:hypothetical protein J3E72DRAFT_429299 [Bipolaris maydis]|nr:hypothetical protein J3E72DRAFT_429299 [Bipolaris maydis]
MEAWSQCRWLFVRLLSACCLALVRLAVQGALAVVALAQTAVVGPGRGCAGHNNVVPSVPRWRWPALSVSVSDSELRLLTDCHGLPQASRAAGHVSAKPHLHRRHALLWHVGYAPPLNDLSQNMGGYEWMPQTAFAHLIWARLLCYTICSGCPLLPVGPIDSMPRHPSRSCTSSARLLEWLDTLAGQSRATALQETACHQQLET